MTSTTAGSFAGARGGSRKSSSKVSHGSRSYPRGVGVDFRKLAGMTLLNYVDHHGMCVVLCCVVHVFLLHCASLPLNCNHYFWFVLNNKGVQVRPEAPPSELAVAVARHFEGMEVDEQDCIGGFLERLENPGAVQVSGGGGGGTTSTNYSRDTAYFDGLAPQLAVRKRRRSKLAARPGEQVAAKVTRTDENGSWILASVQRFYADTETYDVQDEDDTSKLIRLPWTHVMRLSTGTEGTFTKDKECMAIFPETTSFYRSTVSKTPVWKCERNGTPPMVKEIIVKFEDDEDVSGRTPHRRVPARYVIPLPHEYFYEESEDVDLSLAGIK